jgi:monoamine oxidase
MPHVRAEVGGMRFVDSQRLVAALVKELGLPTTAFDNDVNLYYLRGEGFRAQDWATRAPYNATDPRTGKVKDAGQVLEDLFVEIVGNYAPEARADWDAFKAETMQPIDAAAPAAWWKAFKQEAVFGGWPLHEQGLWNVMLRVESIGLEGYDVFRDALGYYSFPANWNAADAVAFLWGDFYKPTYLRVVGGYQQVPLRLVERFQQLGGTVHLGHRLRSLHAAAGSDGPVVELVVDDLARSSRPPIRCLARHVVLAMPRRSLELLDADNLLVTQPGFLADLRAVIPQPMTKAFLAYSTAWWQEEWVPTWDANVGAAPLGEPVALSLTKGKSITDLPLRQCYYVGSEAERAKDFGQDAERGSEQNALLMASYHDGIANDFWDGFGKGSDSAFGDRPGEIPVAEDLRAPWALVAELQRQLAELHGKDQLEIPEPYAALFHDWGQDPFGGAYHLWDVGAKSWEVMPRMRQPVAGTNVYICGEAWSANQGWVAGALDTAERVLQDKFGLARPDTWLPKDYALGP